MLPKNAHSSDPKPTLFLGLIYRQSEVIMWMHFALLLWLWVKVMKDLDGKKID